MYTRNLISRANILLIRLFKKFVKLKMKNKILYILVIIAIIMLIYTTTWFFVIISISSKINQQYANRYISTKSIGTEQEYFIKFDKITSYGFPFKLALQVKGWREEGASTIIKLNSPIYIGYDLIKQLCFISYSGDATGHYKPTQLGFGAKFNSENYSFTAKIPLSIKLLKVFTDKKDPFEIINFVEKLELRSKDTKIIDLYDQKILYDEEHTILSFSFEKNKYYTDIEDFKNHIPQKLHITYSTKILESNVINRKIPAGILLYRFAWPFAFSFTAILDINTNKLLLKDFAKDWEIKMISAESSSNIHNSSTSLLYKNRIEEGINDTYLKVNSRIDLKSDFSNNIINTIQYLLQYMTGLWGNSSFTEELKYIIANQDKFRLYELDNRQYIFDLDANLIKRTNGIVRGQVNNLSLFSNNTGFSLSSECKINSFGQFDATGLIIFNNYLKTFDIISRHVFNLGKFKMFSIDSQMVYKDGIKSFLKNISDHPDSTSNDISFEYKLDSSNIERGKIGTVEFNKILPLYYLELYKKAAEKIRVGDNVITRMQELVPDFNEQQKLLKQLMIQPFQDMQSDSGKELYNTN